MITPPGGLRYYRKSIGLLSDAEFQECYTLNMGSFGMMQERLEEFRYSRTRAFAFMVWDGDILVSWALKYWKRDSWHIYIYTMKAHRRKGYGKFLLTEARRGMRSPIKVYPWDNVSASFYGTVDQSRIINSGTVETETKCPA